MTDLPGRLQSALADRYALEREIGQGGMATVYLAVDLKHRRRVAVKVLRQDLAATLGSDRFFREIEVAARLQHPHILPLLDSGEVEGYFYYVMPFVEGESLRERLARQGELPVNEAVRILSEIADALAAAHAAGVVHRDIKPDNVMLSGRHALVMDFGVAKAVSEATGANQLTTAGVALGTPAYMAPEQAAADPHLDHRVDIYAAGIVAYELLTGRPPFVGLTPQQVLAAHVTQSPDPVDRYRPGIPAALSQVVMKCLAKRPADRWQTAQELLEHLDPLAMPSGGMTPTETRPVSAVLGRARPFPRWAAWMAGGALVAAGALALSLRQGPTQTFVLGRRSPVTTGIELERWPTLAPDGRSVLYTRWDDSTAAIVVQQVNGGAPMVVSAAVPSLKCCQAISPDGSRMLYLGEDGLYVMPTLGGQARKVVGESGQGSWAPDGERVVYVASADSLAVLTVDRPGYRVIATGTDLHSPAWSPDGEWIAFVDGNAAFHFNGNLATSAIKLVSSGGGTPVDVTGSGALHTSPIWMPGRRTILYVSDRDGGRDVYEQALSRGGTPAGPPIRITTGLNPERISLSADGKRIAWSAFTIVSNIWALDLPARDSVPFSAARPVTTGAQIVESGTVSADGVWLYFDSDRSGNSDIWRMPLAGGPPEQLTNDPHPDFSPAVSPDGREVAFHSLRNGSTNRDIFVIPAAGGPAIQISTSRGDDRVPGWSLDGRAVAWGDQDSPDSAIIIARRTDRGGWGPPRRYHTVRGASFGHWTTAGKIEYRTDRGLYQLDPAAGTSSATGVPWTGSFFNWSADRRSFLGVRTEPDRVRVVRITPPDTAARTVAWSDRPLTQELRNSLTVHNGRLFIPLSEPRADIWVAEIAPR